MTEKTYHTRRAELLDEYMRMKRLRLYRSAAARARKIADLDFAYDGTPRNKTLNIFEHDKLMRT